MTNHLDPAPNWLNADYMQKVMRIGLKKPDLSVIDIKVEPGSNIGDNYICQIFRIILTLENGDEFPVIGKLKSNSKMIEAIDSEYDVFGNEAEFFFEILPKLNKVKKQFTPEPYYVDHEHKILFMEDVKAKGYFLQPRKRFLNLQQTKLAVEALAMLHGSSYYAMQEDPKIKEKYKNYFYRNPPNSAILKIIENGLDSLEKWMPTYGLTKDQMEKILGLRKLIFDNWYKICERKDDRLFLLSHGDSHKNNMLFHGTEENIDAVCLLDFQCISYSSFANDLHYFIFFSTECRFITSDLDHILECYFNKLKETAPDIQNLTFERIKTEFRERDNFGIMMGLIFRAFLYADVPVDVDSVVGGDNCEDNGFNNETYIEDVRQLLTFFERRGSI